MMDAQDKQFVNMTEGEQVQMVIEKEHTSCCNLYSSIVKCDKKLIN